MDTPYMVLKSEAVTSLSVESLPFSHVTHCPLVYVYQHFGAASIFKVGSSEMLMSVYRALQLCFMQHFCASKMGTCVDKHFKVEIIW